MATKKKIDLGRAIKARAKGQSIREIARAQGMGKSAVHTALKPIMSMIADPEQLEQYRQQQSAILDTLSARTLASISDEDLQKASLLQKATTAAVLIDKSRLISGQSTSNSLIIHASATGTACSRWGDGHVLEADTRD